VFFCKGWRIHLFFYDRQTYRQIDSKCVCLCACVGVCVWGGGNVVSMFALGACLYINMLDTERCIFVTRQPLTSQNTTQATTLKALSLTALVSTQ
jgi:hypothetical protein